MMAVKFSLSNDEIISFRMLIGDNIWEWNKCKDNATKTLWMLLVEVYEKLNKTSTIFPTKKSFRIDITQMFALHTFLQNVQGRDDYSEVLRMKIFQTIDKRIS